MTIPDDGNRFVFYNLKTDQSLKIDKKVTSEPLESLWWNDRQEISFDIELTVSNSLPLTSFIFKDAGLTMLGEDGNDLGLAYSTEKYSLTKISIPAPTSDNRWIADENGEEYLPYAVASQSEITAQVTLYDFNDQPISTPEPITELNTSP